MDRRRIPGPETSVSPIIGRSEGAKEIPVLDKDDKRHDGRKAEDIRPIFLKTGLITQANGSAYIELCETKIACAIYGPRQTKLPAFSGKGNLNCDFKFASFSCAKRRSNHRDPQEKEFSQLLYEALAPSLRLDLLPKSTIDVYVSVIQNDGTASCLAAAITCASMALTDAGIEMVDQVAACAASYINDEIFIDGDFFEEQRESGSIILSYMPSLNEITHIIQSGEVDVAVTSQAVELCIDVCSKIYSVMRHSLLESVKK
ncbi:9654_t:CDS:2 [Ambispora leptoticha]|uniref:9654_t:CDS:1 n=1 Tax=Ambispora leptoticha TaxID=144679 RepID=A0A9N9D5V4_9GLOM|nr:9654_t:CDS:2 [Ambispora leptoticha]